MKRRLLSSILCLSLAVPVWPQQTGLLAGGAKNAPVAAFQPVAGVPSDIGANLSASAYSQLPMSMPDSRRPRVGGDPRVLLELDSRLRGNDGWKNTPTTSAFDEHSAKENTAGTNIKDEVSARTPKQPDTTEKLKQLARYGAKIQQTSDSSSEQASSGMDQGWSVNSAPPGSPEAPPGNGSGQNGAPPSNGSGDDGKAGPPQYLHPPLMPEMVILDLDVFKEPITNRLKQHLIKLTQAKIYTAVFTEESEEKARTLVTKALGKFAAEKILVLSHRGAQISSLMQSVFLTAPQSKPFDAVEAGIIKSAARQAAEETGLPWAQVQEVYPERRGSRVYYVSLPKIRLDKKGRKLPTEKNRWMDKFRYEFNDRLKEQKLDHLEISILSKKTPRFFVTATPAEVVELRKITASLAEKYNVAKTIYESDFEASPPQLFHYGFRLPRGTDSQAFLKKFNKGLKTRSLPYRAAKSSRSTDTQPEIVLFPANGADTAKRFIDLMQRDKGAFPQEILFIGDRGHLPFDDVRLQTPGATLVEAKTQEDVTGVIEQVLGEWNENLHPEVPIWHFSSSKLHMMTHASPYGSGKPHEEYIKKYLEHDYRKTLYMVLGDVDHELFNWVNLARKLTGVFPPVEAVERMCLTFFNRNYNSSKTLDPRTQEILTHLYAKKEQFPQIYERLKSFIENHYILGPEKPFSYVVKEWDPATNKLKARVATTGRFDLATLGREGGRNILYIHDLKSGLARTEEELKEDDQSRVYYSVGKRMERVWVDGKEGKNGEWVPIDHVRQVYHYAAASVVVDLNESIISPTDLKIIRAATKAQEISQPYWNKQRGIVDHSQPEMLDPEYPLVFPENENIPGISLSDYSRERIIKIAAKSGKINLKRKTFRHPEPFVALIERTEKGGARVIGFARIERVSKNKKDGGFVWTFTHITPLRRPYTLDQKWNSGTWTKDVPVKDIKKLRK